MAELIIGKLTKYRPDTKQHVVFICPELAEAVFGIHTEQPEPRRAFKQITVAYGQNKTIARAIRWKATQCVGFSGTLWHKLSIPYPHTVHFHYDKDTLRIGPLVGIMNTRMIMNNTVINTVHTPLMKRFLMTQRDLPASCFVFGPDDVRSTQKRIAGHFLRFKNGEKYWEQHEVPFPDVVYDRVLNRRAEKTAAVHSMKERLQASGVSMFNQGFFNKWDIHERIAHQPEAAPYIPETIFTPTAENIHTLLSKHRIVYLKPADGSLGMGIIKLYAATKNNGYYMRYRSGQRNQLKHFHNLETLLHHIPRSKREYIAQQGIRLIKANRRAVDFRVHTNKDRHGEWLITAIGAKAAGPGSVTTHVRMGGTILPYTDVIRKNFSANEVNLVLRNLEEAVLSLSRAIENGISGPLGEIGFDIGIDEAGHPWMFEANSKPGRHVFVHPSMRNSEHLTRKMLFDYALHLAHFSESVYSKIL